MEAPESVPLTSMSCRPRPLQLVRWAGPWPSHMPPLKAVDQRMYARVHCSRGLACLALCYPPSACAAPGTGNGARSGGSAKGSPWWAQLPAALVMSAPLLSPRGLPRFSHVTSFVCQAKIVHVSLDGLCVSPPEGFLIRKGPGNCHFDFAQEILFVDYLRARLLPQPARR